MINISCFILRQKLHMRQRTDGVRRYGGGRERVRCQSLVRTRPERLKNAPDNHQPRLQENRIVSEQIFLTTIKNNCTTVYFLTQSCYVRASE